MKTIQYGIWIALLLFCFGCNDDDSLPQIKPEATGTMQDKDGNEYKWVRYGGLDWMASNLIAGTPFYEDEDYWDVGFFGGGVALEDEDQVIADYENFGNLYTYEKALEHRPEGWRLPTDEDWKKLEQALGMSESAANSRGWRGNESELMQQDATGTDLNMVLGGCVFTQATTPTSWPLQYVRIYGCYWTSTVDESYTLGTAVYYRRIFANNSKVEREITPIIERDYINLIFPKLMSVRYVRDAQ